MIEVQPLTQAIIDLFAQAFPVALVMGLCICVADFALSLLLGKRRVNL